jgi:hypothetical protein
LSCFSLPPLEFDLRDTLEYSGRRQVRAMMQEAAAMGLNTFRTWAFTVLNIRTNNHNKHAFDNQTNTFTHLKALEKKKRLIWEAAAMGLKTFCTWGHSR